MRRMAARRDAAELGDARAGDVGARRLPQVRDRHWSGSSVRCWWRRVASPPASACSTLQQARATSPSAPPRRAPRWWRRTSRRRTSRRVAAKPRAQDVELEWVEADAEALPFADDEFDVVTSSFGAMFAPGPSGGGRRAPARVPTRRHDRHAQLHPRGLGCRLLRHCSCPTCRHLHRRRCRRSSGGARTHVRELFGDRVKHLEMTRGEYVERAATPRDYCELLQGDVRTRRRRLRRSSTTEPERAATLDREFLEFATRSNRGAPGGPAEYHYEYLLMVARKRAG